MSTEEKLEENFQNFIDELERISKKYGFAIQAIGGYRYWDVDGFKDIEYSRDYSSGDLVIKKVIFSDGDEAEI